MITLTIIHLFNHSFTHSLIHSYLHPRHVLSDQQVVLELQSTHSHSALNGTSTHHINYLSQANHSQLSCRSTCCSRLSPPISKAVLILFIFVASCLVTSSI